MRKKLPWRKNGLLVPHLGEEAGCFLQGERRWLNLRRLKRRKKLPWRKNGLLVPHLRGEKQGASFPGERRWLNLRRLKSEEKNSVEEKRPFGSAPSGEEEEAFSSERRWLNLRRLKSEEKTPMEEKRLLVRTLREKRSAFSSERRH